MNGSSAAYGRHTRMPSAMTHIPLDGDGVGVGEDDGAGAGVGEEPADDVGAGGPRRAAAACPRPAELLGAAAARAWT
jgi:hypothetical protein